MKTRAVLFDLDGTLVDSLPGIASAVDCCLEECALPPRQSDLRRLIGPPIRAILQELVPDADEQLLSRMEQAFRRAYNSEAWRKTVVHDGAIEILRELRGAALPVFLVTNKPHVPTSQILNQFGMASLFTRVLCRDTKEPPFQSKTEMLEYAIAAHELHAATCLYVGDSLEDYRAAQEAGIPVALVAHGYGAPELDLADCTALNHLSEVLNIAGILEAA